MREIIAFDDPLKRQFYAEMCRIERWSTRTLQEKIAGMLYERTAIAKRPAAVVERSLATMGDQGRMTPDLVFRDPYVLDFLGLPSDDSEQEMETAILREMESFLLEMGLGFGAQGALARPAAPSANRDSASWHARRGCPCLLASSSKRSCSTPSSTHGCGSGLEMARAAL